MFRGLVSGQSVLRGAAGVIIATLLTSWWTPAQAAAPKPLRLTSVAVSVDVAPVPDGGPVVCNEFSYACGIVTVAAEFAGLDGRSRPAAGDVNSGLNLYGTVRVTRTYGCEGSRGQRLRRYDRTVRQVEPLNTRRGFPQPVPQEGDRVDIATYTFLLGDAQPGNCPRGTEARLYAIEAKQVRLELVSRWAAIPSARYTTCARARWRGAAPTPVQA